MPSIPAGRLSSRTTCGWRRLSSAASSIVITRSPGSMNDGERVEDGRLARAGAAADDQVAALDRRPRAAARAARSSKRAAPDQLVRVGADAGEPADRDRGPVDRERRDDHVDPRAVGEAPVGHRAELVDAAADRAEDPLDHVAQLRPRRRRRPSVRSSRPRRSIQTSSWPLTRTSSTSGSRSSSSSGPRPTVSRSTRSASSLAPLARRAPPPRRRPARRPRRASGGGSPAPATASARRCSISLSRSSAGERVRRDRGARRS